MFGYIDLYTGAVAGETGAQAYARTQRDMAHALDLHRKLGSRMLIAEEIRKARISERWAAAMAAHSSDLDAEYQPLADEIVNIGIKA